MQPFARSLKDIVIWFSSQTSHNQSKLMRTVFPPNLYRLLHIFSIFQEKSTFKGLAFRRLVEFCDKEKQLAIIVENVKKVDEISKEWNLSV